MVKELCTLDDRNQYTEKQVIANSKSILENANNAIEYQSSGVSKDSASQLLN